jgi:acyl carrier protein
MLTPPTTQRIETVVHASIRDLLAERGHLLQSFDAGTRLNAGLGLSSLDLAQLVVDLEVAFGVDPFASLVPVTSVLSVGDLVAAYRLAFAGEKPPEDPGLNIAEERAQKRKARRGGR